MAATAIATSILPNKRIAAYLLKNPSPSTRTLLHPQRTHLDVNKPILLERAAPAASPFQFSPATTSVMEIPTIGEAVEGKKQRGLGFLPTKVLILLAATFWMSLAIFLFCGVGKAAAAVASDSIGASSFGLKVAAGLRGFGWPDQAVVFALATLPVLELRGAIPVGYWMQLKPLHLTVLAILGNMVPVPFIILYLKKFATFLAGKNSSTSGFIDLMFTRATEKAGPVEEFQWLGLMLFVAVPFPGTGAWTGAIIASILDMPFWSAFTANFSGVVFASLLTKSIDFQDIAHHRGAPPDKCEGFTPLLISQQPPREFGIALNTTMPSL
ncbi:hypothetical protein ACLOJK_031728 [Asimina triloba]